MKRLAEKKEKTLWGTTYPCKWQPDNDVQPAGHQETSKVVHTARRIREEHAVPHDADGAEQDAEEAALLGAVGEKCRGHVGGGAEEVAGDGEELDLRGRPGAQVSDDGWEEG